MQNKKDISGLSVKEVFELLEDVVQDYANRCCDNHKTCACSMGRAARFVQANSDRN